MEAQKGSQLIWGMKYRFSQESQAQNLERVAKALSEQELESERKKWYKEFLWTLQNGGICAGRIMSNAGAERPSVSLINCVVSGKIYDEMTIIMDAVKDVAISLKYGSGIGMSFSTLRPKGTDVVGVGTQSSGPISFMEIFDAACKTIMSGGGRRGAMMATFAIHHPNIVDFIRAKRKNGTLTQFNLSLLITNEFMEAVETNGIHQTYFPAHANEIDLDYEFVWKPWPITEGYKINEKGEVLCRVYETMPARDLYELIMNSTYEFADPGFLLIDNINANNNMWFCEDIQATNPCVTGDTLILTDEGYKRIDSCLNVQTNIWNGWEWSTVVPKLTAKDQKLLHISFSNGSGITCTPYHEFLLNDDTRVEAKNLIPGHKLTRNNWPVIESGVDVLDASAQGFFSGDGGIKEQKGDSYLRYGKTDWKKTFVPDTRWSVKSRLAWLAGISDSAGCVAKVYNKMREVSSIGLQVTSKDKEFLVRIQLMLNTLGEGSSVQGMKDYWRLNVSPNSVKRLSVLGFNTHRLDFSPNNPQREGRHYVKVVSVDVVDARDDVFCFNEPKRHTGIFGGVITRQCGEQPLFYFGACLLGSINLTKFVEKPFTDYASFNWEKFERVTRNMCRMLDNVCELNGLPLQQQRDEIMSKRRHGLGYLGLGSAMVMLGMTYGSEKSITFTETVTKSLAYTGWVEGLKLAREKGPAPIMNQIFTITEAMLNQQPALPWKVGEQVKGMELFIHGNYMKKIAELDPQLVKDIGTEGSRYTHHSSIAPTGTISMAFADNASGGIEPSFGHEYYRNLDTGKEVKEKVKMWSHELRMYRGIVDETAGTEGGAKLPPYFVEADEIDPYHHIDVQAAAQKWVDSSISKTINVATDFPFDKFKDLYKYAWRKGLKGVTTFRFNPEQHQGVLVREEDLKNMIINFKLVNGQVITVNGNQKVEYNGEIVSANNLFTALRSVK